MKNAHAVTGTNVTISGGFWGQKQELIRKVSVWNVYKRFKETGRFDALKFQWKEGEPNKPHIFWDSDVAKWMEAVAYLCERKREPELEAIVDTAVGEIEKNRMPDGYFNSYFGQIEPENRFTRQSAHELYCAGHWLEAAIAYKHATGKGRFLELIRDYIDLIYRIFYVEKSAAFTCPGHEEIELALVKLYRETGDKRYLDLSLYFVEQRGQIPEHWPLQDHLPIREQKTAEGHAVRACYLFSAVADLAKETGDETLKETAKTLFNNIVSRRMYVTGAVGQTPVQESFMEDYDLPNQTAYAETCANLSLAMFARRMSVLEPDGVYADTAERVLFNSFISGMSLDGKSFFYSNMQENDLNVRRRHFDGRQNIFRPDDQRVEVFDCSCCPPNMLRAIASIGDYMAAANEETVWIHQYFPGSVRDDGREITLTTEYPQKGTVKLSYRGKQTKLALRIPGWCEAFNLAVNGNSVNACAVKGYVTVPVTDGDELVLTMEMPIKLVEANPKVWEDAGRVAVTRGPLVYCLESVDQPELPLRDIRLSSDRPFTFKNGVLPCVPVLSTVGRVRTWDDRVLYGRSAGLKEVPVTLIPYFAMANRGETNMLIWTLEDRD